jgi:hypothetical protein
MKKRFAFITCRTSPGFSWLVFQGGFFMPVHCCEERRNELIKGRSS